MAVGAADPMGINSGIRNGTSQQRPPLSALPVGASSLAAAGLKAVSAPGHYRNPAIDLQTARSICGILRRTGVVTGSELPPLAQGAATKVRHLSAASNLRVRTWLRFAV